MGWFPQDEGLGRSFAGGYGVANSCMSQAPSLEAPPPPLILRSGQSPRLEGRTLPAQRRLT